jgi:type II restriction enzyme
MQQFIGDLIPPMKLSLPSELAQAYKSAAQQARVVTQAWAGDNLFCANCSSMNLTPMREGSEANDFTCPQCSLRYELKSKSAPIGRKIHDAGFNAMIRAIREDHTPNLVVMHYEKPQWKIKNLILVPHFAFPESAIEKCAPLSETHPRHGHVLCNIVLEQIPSNAKIPLVVDGAIQTPNKVREHFKRLEPLKRFRAGKRSWTLDVLRVVQSLGKTQFTNNDVYDFEDELKKLHPDNRHIRDKIRQQLQKLRDRNLLLHVGRNCWRLS